MHLAHIAFSIVTGIFSLVYAGVVYFNYLARGKRRSLREIRLTLLCWAAWLAVYAASSRYALSEEALICLALSINTIGLTSGLQVNAMQQRRDAEQAPV